MLKHLIFCGACLLGLGANNIFAQDFFANAGIQPDAFLDWSKLPAAPAANPSPFTATIPVTGAPGLTASVTFTVDGRAVSPEYTVIGNTTLRVPSSNGTVKIVFSSPIQGIRLIAQAFGRFGHRFQMIATNVNGPALGPQTFESSSAGSDASPGTPSDTPLQIVEDSAKIASITFVFTGPNEEYRYFALDNVRIQTGSNDPSGAVPRTGLLQWLRADAGVFPPPTPILDSQPVNKWADQSGNGMDATQDDPNAAPAFVIQDGPNGKPSLAFGGKAFLKSQLPINGLDGMTIFLVARANSDVADGSFHSQSSAVFWAENSPWGNTYVSPFQTHLGYRFGTTQIGNDPELTRPENVGGDYTLTTAIHDGSTDSLYVNGDLRDTESGKQTTLAGMTGDEFIGQGFQNTFFTGDIAEILVYKRALNAGERSTVENYLTTKYGLK